MKKGIVLLTMMIFILSFSSMAFAGAFADVPANHWAYSAVNKLAKDGILENSGNFDGNRTITRYEMAMFVARAMEKSDKADATDRAIIDKLAVEFENELKSIGVRLKAVEEKADQVNIRGFLGFRYDWKKTASTSKITEAAHLDLQTDIRVNEDTVVGIETIAHKNLLNSSDRVDDTVSTGDYNKVNTLCVITNIDKKVQLVAGEFKFIPAYGMVASSEDIYGGPLKGVKAKFGGDVVTTTLFYGRNPGPLGTIMDSTLRTPYKYAEFDFAVSKTANIKMAYHKTPNADYKEIGFDTKVVQNLKFMAATAQSNLSSPNRGTFAQLTYKQALPWGKKPVLHSYDLWVAYHNIPANSTLNGGCVSDFYGNYYEGFKGQSYGCQYVFAKNVMLTTFVLDGKQITSQANFKVYRAQMDFFF